MRQERHGFAEGMFKKDIGEMIGGGGTLTGETEEHTKTGIESTNSP